MPISLRYNAVGFRPDEHPGWVGMGWSLQAGGVITRVVNGEPDEFAVPAQLNGPSMYPTLGYYYTNQILNSSTSTWSSQNTLSEIAARTISSNYANVYPYANSGYTLIYPDSEPDEFSFVLPGISGSFYKDSDGDGTLQGRGTWKVRCDQPVKVEVNNPSEPLLTIPLIPEYGPDGKYRQFYGGQYPKTFSGFTITTSDGTRYVFGHDKGIASPSDRPAIEYSINLFDQLNDSWTASAWYLTKVLSLSGEEITLSYEREPNATPGRYIAQLYNYTYDEYAVEQATPTYTPDWAINMNEYLRMRFTASQSCTLNSYSNEDMSVNGKLVAPVYLRSITSRIGQVQFTRSLSTELRYIPEIAYKKFNPKSTGGPIEGTNFSFLAAKFNNQDRLDYNKSIARLQWQKLDQIIIKAQGEILKKINLTYSDNPARPNNATLALTQRLTLLAVNEEGKDGMKKPPHRFAYYNETQGGLLTSYNGTQGLPNYLMLVSDHWGFYNNPAPQTSPTTLSTSRNFPDFSNLPAYYTLREPNPNATVYQRGLLTQITYPTGGYSNFEYEQHRYGSQVDTTRTVMDPAQTTSRIGGGVRIKRITSATVANPAPGEQVVTDYYYVKGYTAGANHALLPSSGVLGNQISYGYRRRVFPVKYDQTASQQGYYRTSVFSSQSVLPACGNVQGSHIGYSQVVEKRSDGSFTKY